jgi:hypothetical protein
VNDHDEAKNLAQDDEYAQELDALLDLLKIVDSEITPEHVAKRFHDLLDEMGESSVTPQPGAELGGFTAIEPLLEEPLGEACAPTTPARLTTAAAAEARRCIEDAHRRAEEMQDTALAKAARIEAEARETARRILVAARLVAASADTAGTGGPVPCGHSGPGTVASDWLPALLPLACMASSAARSLQRAASPEETPTQAAELNIVLVPAA